jgi:hypothetical protein
VCGGQAQGRRHGKGLPAGGWGSLLVLLAPRGRAARGNFVVDPPPNRVGLLLPPAAVRLSLLRGEQRLSASIRRPPCLAYAALHLHYRGVSLARMLHA